MTFDQLLDEISARAILLRKSGDELIVRCSEESLNSSLLAQLRAHKPALFDLITGDSEVWWSPATITPEMLPLVELTSNEINRIVIEVPGGAANVQDIYPLAPLQEGMLFHHLMGGEGDPYLLAQLMSFDSRSRLDSYVEALQAVIDRHDILRTAVMWEGLPEPVQVVWRKARLPIEEVELEGGAGDAEKELYGRFDPRRKRIDLRRAPLMRCYIANDRENGRWLMVHLLHHLTGDHTTLEVMQDEVQAHLLGQAEQLPVPLPFRNLIAQARLELEVSRDEHEEFFRQMLGDVEEPTAPFGLMNVQVEGTEIEEARLEVGAGVVRRLRDQARKLGISVASLCHVAWGQVLARVSGHDDVVFGTVLSGRMQGVAGAHRVMGLFINTLPVRIRICEEGVETSVRRTHSQLAELLRHEHASLALAQRCSGVPAPVPLFSALLNYRHSSDVSKTSLAEKRLAWEGIKRLHAEERTNYPFTMSVDDLDSKGLRLTGQVQVSIGAMRVCEFMHRALEGVADALEKEPSKLINSVQILPEAEERQVLVEWNDTRVEYGEGKCLHELFEAQVERSAEAIAVTYEGQEVSYGELNRRANQLGHYLQGLGVGPEVRVGLCLERSVELVVGILGILKAGGAYVPLDPDYPQERLAFMLEDSAPAVLLTQGHLQGLFSGISGSMPVLDLADATPPWRGQAESNPERTAMGLTGEHLAYVIYTSGSTGRPKGVMNAHCGVVNRLVWMQRAYGLEPHDAVLQKTPVSFDVSVWEFFCPLMTGARLVMARPNGHKDPGYLVEAMRNDQVTTVHFVPSMLQVFLDHAEAAKHSGLRRVICSGEVLPAKVARCFQERLTSGLHNLYGPTEAAIDVTAWTCPADTTQESIPIGRPVANTQIYILDEHLEAVPVGIAGELHVGGVQVARGYLNRPDLTAERFIPNPYGEEAGGRLYKTGDLGRYQRDGDIEYLGRSDYQVKIRGFRIELGEIEAVLSRHGQVKEAVVIAREDTPGEKRLVAYVTAVEEEAPNAEELREHLKGALPEYMVPSAFVVLEAMPLTANGKVDRKALPAVDFTAQQTRRYEAPQGEIEEILATIWQELLHVERVGRHDNFFELGGDSILSIQIVGRARQASLSLTVTQLFEHQTIAELAGVADWQGLVATPQGVVSGEVVLTPIQRWFFEQEQVDSHHFNQSVLLEVRHALSSDLVAEAVKHLLRQHDALRMRFIREGEEWQQVNLSQETGEVFTQVDLAELSSDAQRAAVEAGAAQLQGSLDLGQGPLLRVALFDYGSGRVGRLLLIMHHLVVDGVSWRILLEDLQLICGQLERGEAVHLGPKTSSFQQWAGRLNEYAQSEIVHQEVEYWLDLGRRGADGALPVEGRWTQAETGGEMASVSVRLSAEETQALLQHVPAVYHTQINDVLLTALAEALKVWSGSQAVWIDLEGHGREELFDDIDLTHTVGWFTTFFPVRLELPGSGGAGAKLRAVKEQLRQVPQRGIGYGLLRYLCADAAIREQVEKLPRAEVSFNYLGQLDQVLGADAYFGSARESSGPSCSPRGSQLHRLVINASVAGGCLELHWSYSLRRDSRAAVEALAQNYGKALRELIAHCLLPGMGGYTPSDFPLVRLGQEDLDKLLGGDRQVEDLYPLSPMQQGMLFHSLLESDAELYLRIKSIRLEGDVRPALLRSSWQQVVDRHSILRTAFLWEDSRQPLQLVRLQATVPWEEQDWRGMSGEEQQEKLARLLDEEQKRGLALSEAPLMRLSLVQLGEQVYELVLVFHHLLLDGWCLPVLIKEVYEIYAGLCRGEQVVLERPRPYRDYIAWLQRQDLAKAEIYWRQNLQGFKAPTKLAVERSAGQESERPVHRSKAMRLSQSTTQALEEFGQRHRITLNTLVQGGWGLLLSRYSSEPDVVFGSVVSGRPPELAGVERMVGLFINTLPVRIRVEDEISSLAWLQQLQQQQVEMRQYDYTPLAQIQQWSEVPGGTALFQSHVAFENYPAAVIPRETGVQLQAQERLMMELTNYSLWLGAIPETEMLLQLCYDERRFEAQTIEKMMGHLRILLEGIVAHPEGPVGELPLMSEAEERQILVEWNDTRVEYGEGKCLHELFEAQVERSAEAIAVTYEGQEVSYGELNRRANQLGHYLQGLGVGPEVRVGLCLERSVELVVGILGILKAGGAYVPLDPDYPQERLAFMLEDSAPAVLLTQHRLVEQLPSYWAPTVCLDTDWGSIAREGKEDLASAVDIHHAAYVIYTTGSTGQPKGVIISHRAIANYLDWASRAYALEDGQGALVHSPIGFDLTVTSLFTPLLVGCRVVLVSEEQGINALSAAFGRDIFCLVKVTPAHLEMLRHSVDTNDVAKVKILVIGGEALLGESLSFWRTHAPKSKQFNEYGPTEAVVGCCVFELPTTTVQGMVPIGQPVANTQIYILDEHGKPVPVGVAGEIYIGGVQVARGYLNRPDLTAERFIPNPYGEEAGGRLYKTGDLGRYQRDGDIEYLGRSDYQVKIRGFRIELGEIEAVLSRHGQVKEAVVIAREDTPGEKRLVAYVTTVEEEAPNAEELREHLKGALPEYMVPSAFVVLEAMPLTANGKVDRKALPAVDFTAQQTRRYEAPQGEIEEILATIWQELLHVERVGRHDNFFELGGHSLLAVQAISRLRESFRVEISLRNLFEAPTIASLREKVEAALRQGVVQQAPALVRVPREGDVALSFAQQRLWFIAQLEPNNTAYNVPAAVRLRGKLNVTALEQTLSEVIRRHEVLRTIFKEMEGRAVQVIMPAEPVKLFLVDLSEVGEEEREGELMRLAKEEAEQRFDLTQGPLLRVWLLRLGEEDQVVFFTMHHIVSDGWSREVLIREVTELYKAFSEGRVSPLPELPIQYGDYAVWQRDWMRGEVFEEQLNYWKNQLKDLPVLELPTDRTRPAVRSSRGATERLQLSPELSEGLKKLSQQEGVTLFMTLLAALHLLLGLPSAPPAGVGAAGAGLCPRPGRG